MKLSFNKDEVFRSSINLGMSGINMPVISPEEIKNKFGVEGKALEQFGWFGGSNNANTFYPGLDVPEELMPKPEDFIRVPFRLLSATVVGAGTWKATDFSNIDLLKASASKLTKKPIYYDHDTDLLNWVGIVESTTWEDAKGDVPGGINALLAIDAKTNPKIARGVLIGAIFSNSVTVEFDWIPSHSFNDAYEFENHCGTISAKDGKMIRRIVTNIYDYYETSLVWLGADPYAKLIDENGDLVNVDESSTYKLEKETAKNQYEKDKRFSIGLSLDKNILSLNKQQSKQQINFVEMKKELLIMLTSLLGLQEGTELTKEHLSKLSIKTEGDPTPDPTLAKLSAIDDEGNPLESLPSIEKEGTHLIVAKDTFEKFKTEAAKVTQLEADAKIGRDSIQAKRDEVKRLYGLSVGENSDDSVLSLIDSAKPEQLDGLMKQYAKGATGKFTATCKKCGEKDSFEFRSSEGTLGEGGEPTPTSKSASFSDLMDKFDNITMFPGK